MIELAAGMLILLIVIMFALYLMKSMTSMLFRLFLTAVLIMVVLYYIPVDWNSLVNNENLEPIRILYSKLALYIKTLTS